MEFRAERARPRGSGGLRQPAAVPSTPARVGEEAGAQLLRPDEWRKAPPGITSDGKEVRIRMETHSWVNERHVALGPWRIETGLTRWTIRFKAPEALRAARWDTIEIDPGTPGAEWARPEPSAGRGAHALVWKPSTGSARSIPEIEVRTTPPWQRAWAARDGRDMNNISVLGGLLWMVGIAAVATGPALQRPRLGPAAVDAAPAAWTARADPVVRGAGGRTGRLSSVAVGARMGPCVLAQ
ncbi:DUF6185 family protein [Streptomyces swartbergensis]|uniref:DUF6185 family protein n=1 Tax=Streptomyces swartbergensis TaxID=487165 RepID=UPI003807A1EC